MKDLSVLLCLLFVTTGSMAQVQDDFTDGDFIVNPSWTGDQAKFEVNSEHQLHLNAPAVTDAAYLSTPNSSIDNTEWLFYYGLCLGGD